MASARGGRCSRRHESAGRDRPHVGDEKVVAALERLGGLLVDAGGEPWRAGAQAEKHPLPPRRERARFGEGECGVVSSIRRGRANDHRGLAQYHAFATDEMDAGARVRFERGDRGGIRTPIGGTIEHAIGVAEIWRNPEIRARQHDSLRRAREGSHGPPRCAIRPIYPGTSGPGRLRYREMIAAAE